MTSKMNIFNRNAQPFIKWAGGKRGLLSQILPHFSEEFNNYFEPFIGGGAVFFELYSQGKLNNKNVYLFDINSELVNTYEVVKNNPETLLNELERFKSQHSKEFYNEVRAWDRKDNFNEIDKVLRATRFIYLNKTCFNGLYRVNKKNQNNVPMGNYKNPGIYNPEVIYNASEALQIANILNTSYKDVLKYVQKDDLVYLDPPYYPLNPTSSFTSYSEFEFLDNQQNELYEVFEKLDELGAFVFESNSDTQFIENLYNNYKDSILKVYANRFINSKSKDRGKISEVLISNRAFNIKIEVKE